MAHDLVIYGAGGAGKGAAQIVRDINAAAAEPAFRLLGYLDADTSLHGAQFQGHAVLGDHSWLRHNPAVQVAVAIANPEDKAHVVKEMRALGHCHFATLIHPRAWLADSVEIGCGSIVYALAAVNADAASGEFTLLNMHSAVGHDARLGDYCTVAPGAKILGAAVLAEGVELGANSIVLAGVAVGAWAVLGAGAVATKSLPAGSTAVGIPAAVIKLRPVKE